MKSILPFVVSVQQSSYFHRQASLVLRILLGSCYESWDVHLHFGTGGLPLRSWRPQDVASPSNIRIEARLLWRCSGRSKNLQMGLPSVQDQSFLRTLFVSFFRLMNEIIAAPCWEPLAVMLVLCWQVPLAARRSHSHADCHWIKRRLK
jgi:hypothetical protein